MNSILRKAMLPAAVAVAMVGFVGAFGAGNVPTAHAIQNDICTAGVQTDATSADPTAYYNNANGPVDYVTSPGETIGLVFRVEDSVGDNVQIRLDSETGAARVNSQAEILDYENADPTNNNQADVGHILVQPATGSIVVDTIDPEYFSDADGHALDDINAWLTDVGYTGFANNADSVCGQSDQNDGWGFIDFSCIEAGYFHVDIMSPGDTEEIGHTLKFYCEGQADSATMAVSPSTVETNPVGSSKSYSLVTVTVEDQFGNRLDNAKVTLSTDNCTFKNTGSSLYSSTAGITSATTISPAGGGTTVNVWSDTEATGADQNYLADNTLEHQAGTAEAVLDCSHGKAGVANIKAIVQRDGADIVLSDKVTVVGQTSATGLVLTLNPNDLECGNAILATVTAVDSLGQPVSDGTEIYFVTDTSSGIQGGGINADGAVETVGGEASVLIATDPGNGGTHTVIAYTVNSAGTVNAQTSESYTCDEAVAPAAPTVAPPATGTGTGSITPPNTGDAGLADSSQGGPTMWLALVSVAVITLFSGLGLMAFRNTK